MKTLKPLVTIILGLFLLLTTFNCYAQNLLNNPESVVFDPSQNRYLVSNWADGDGRIVQIDSNGVQSYFSTILAGQFKIAGLYMYHDTLLAASGVSPNAGISGFDLLTGDTLFHIVLPSIGLPNDITSDSNGVIYVTDYWDSKLYKIENHVPSVFISQGLVSPNGICYDVQNHRLLILSVSGSNSPILAVDPEDATITTLVYTGFPALDGITMDNNKNIYFSTWSTDEIYKYGPEFVNPPELFSSGHNDPADIYFDKWNELLAVPNFSSHTIDFVQLITMIPENIEVGFQKEIFMPQNHPNPFNHSTTIDFEILKETKVVLNIYDLYGKEVKMILDAFQESGKHSVVWDGKDNNKSIVSPGIYYFSIKTNNNLYNKKMIKISHKNQR